MSEPSSQSLLPPSKRAARRIIQRAFVLTGRDRQLRQHIREIRLTTLWILEDWDLVWTVNIDRGRIEFERRPAKHPDLTLSWQTAEEFFSRAGQSFRPRAEQRGGISPPPEGVSPKEAPRCARDGSESGLPESSPKLAENPELRRVATNLLKSFLGNLGHVLRNPVDGAGESLL